ncbi:MAG: hypothetical protein GKR97_18460 [Rhizobiaceae bacterium]|nr:hypothetical protein [Rhizobiaceae bacterium]
MSRFSDAALLQGNFAHMAAELRTGQRAAPKTKDWNKASCDNQAEETAQEVAKHIFSLQKSVDVKTEKLEILHFTSVGMMKVLALIPGEGDVLRLDGVLENGNPVAQAMHASQLSLTFIKAPLKMEDNEDDGLEIGFLIFDQLTKRRKARDKRLRKLSLQTTQKIPSAKKSRGKSRTAQKAAK